MKTASTILTAVVLVILLAGAAHAANLFTPPVSVDAGDGIECLIVNVSGMDRVVTIEIKEADGTNAVSASPFILGAGLAAGISVAGTGALRYCHFSVAGGKTKPPPGRGYSFTLFSRSWRQNSPTLGFVSRP